MKKVIFYAPVGTNVPAHLLGGGEKGCRRTREILTSNGFEVITVDKATMGKGLLNYIKDAVLAVYKVKKFINMDSTAIVYVVGFYEKNLLLEYIILSLGKGKTIYEARNGRLIKAYEEYGSVYKRLMDKVLKKADSIFAQGLEYVDFIKKKYGKTAVYTPNYVLNRNLKPYCADRSFDIIKLIYFGRVSESKNVDVAIKVAGLLEKRGIPVELTIIGGYTEEYYKKLSNIINSEKLNEKVFIMGQQPFEVIINQLQSCHFFVFPSQEKMEGHSNSLTEAMTFGVVPIASSAGFNRSICGEDDLIIDGINPEDYASVVEKIVRENSWREFSMQMYNRIKQNYTEDIVKNAILTEMKRL